MSPHREHSQPFGVASRDPFDPASCPACRAPVGPRTHFCSACFATHDLAASRGQLLLGPTAQLSRTMQVALAALGLLVALSAVAAWGDAALAPALGWAAPLGVALLIVGVGGWVAFPRHALVASSVTGTLFLALAVGLLLALARWPAFAALGRLVVTIEALLCGAAFLAFRGVPIGLRQRRLRVVPRPAETATDGYR
jgi:hypothetical protein